MPKKMKLKVYYNQDEDEVYVSVADLAKRLKGASSANKKNGDLDRAKCFEDVAGYLEAMQENHEIDKHQKE